MTGVFATVGRVTRALVNDRISVYNTVAVRDTPLFDGLDHEPDYKTALCDTIQSEVSPGDSVVFVGGGRGVAPTWAARQGADVTVYEAASEMVDVLEETARLNQVDYTIQHAVVGQARRVYGSLEDAVHVSPRELAGDILVLDCEGAELDILPTDAFERVIVETHPRYGAPTDRVLDQLGDGKVVAPDPVDGDVVVA